MENQTIFITGITGQDGIFLTSQLINEKNNLKIYGSTRLNDQKGFFSKLDIINKEINEKSIDLLNLNLEEGTEVRNVFQKIKPDYVINLSGPSSVNQSLTDNNKTKESINKIFDNLINSSMELEKLPTFFEAGSSEMFSNKNKNPLNEDSKFETRSPYAKAKYENFIKIKELRESYRWDIKTGILFNHESELRPKEYLFSKLINEALQIKNKDLETIEVGSLSYIRDWTFAGDVADAINLIAFSNIHEDFVIGSGIGNSIEELIQIIFEELDLDYKKHIKINQELLRDGDPEVIISDPSKVKDILGWAPKLNFKDLVKRCLDYKLTTT